MPISFPKQVEIVNWRLDALFATLAVITGVVLTVTFFVSHKYSKFTPVGSYIDAFIWDNGTQDYESLAAVTNQTQRTAAFCTDPEEYDYWYDLEGTLSRYDQNSCLPLCPRGLISELCILEAELALLEPGSVFLISQISTQMLSDGTNKTSNYLVPSVDHLGVQFFYSYKIPSEGFFGQSTPGPRVGIDHIFERSSTSEITTVILDSNEDKWMTIKPSNAITLSLHDLFMLAGEPDALDTLNELSGANYVGGSYKAAGAFGRVSGLELNLIINCYNYPALSYIEEHSETQDVCYVRVRPTYTGWNSISQTDVVGSEGATRKRILHGTRVKIVTGGAFQFTDSNNIMLNVTSAIVLLRLTRTVILFFSISCLGLLSGIYRRVIYERFHITAQIGGQATRLMANSASFVELEDSTVEDADESSSRPEPSISRHRMHERLAEVLKYRRNKLDEAEVQAFVSLCFKSIVDQEFRQQYKKSGKGIAGDVVGQDDFLDSSCPSLAGLCGWKSKVKKHPKALPNIDIDSFSVALASQDKIAFDDFVDLFDRHRTISIMERLFWPSCFERGMSASEQFIASGFAIHSESSLKRVGRDLEDGASVVEQQRSGRQNNSLEEEIRMQVDATDAVHRILSQEQSRQERADRTSAHVTALQERLDDMEEFCDDNMTERIEAYEDTQKIAPETQQEREMQEWVAELERQVLKLAQENQELVDEIGRLEEVRTVEHRKDVERVVDLEQRLMRMEEMAYREHIDANIMNYEHRLFESHHSRDVPEEETLLPYDPYATVVDMRPASGNVSSELGGPTRVKQSTGKVRNVVFL